MKQSKIWVALLAFVIFSWPGLAGADTPPPNSVKAKIYDGTGTTAIGNVSDSLKVDVTNAISAAVSSSPSSPLYDSIVVGGVVIDPRNRNWNLSSGSDSVSCSVSNFPGSTSVTQGTSPWVISAASLPLPAGASTESTVAAINAKLNSLGQKTSANSVPVVLASDQPAINVNATLGSSGNTIGKVDQGVVGTSAWKVDGSSVTQPISAAALPLPSGASTESTLSALNSKVTTTANGIKVDGSGVTQPVSGAVSVSNFPANQTVVQPTGSNLHVAVDSLPSVSGTVTVNQGTSPWVSNVSQFGGSNVVTGVGNSGAGIPRVTVSSDSNITNITGTVTLPTLASTSTKQSDGSQKTQLVDGANATVGPVTAIGGVNYAPVIQASSGTPGAAVPARSTVVAGSDGTNAQTLSTDNTGKLNINNISGTVVLPNGASTSANQTSQITQETTTASNTTSMLANQTNGTQKTQVTLGPADSTPGTQTITTQDVGTTTTAQANGQNAMTGTPSAGSAASFAVSSVDTIGIQVTGVWTGTLVTEISRDGGTTWFTRGVKQSGASYVSSTFTQNFEGGMNGASVTNVRVRSTASLPGSATVRIITSVNPESLAISNPLTLRDSTTQSVADTIKAASTAAVATDTALVVSLSPNGNQAVATAQGASLGSNTQTMVGGSVATNNPSYSTGNIQPLSITTRGGLRTKEIGFESVQLVRNDYSSTNVTTAAYTQLIASTAADINYLMISDTSGQDFVLATGAAASEVDQIQISPGGWDFPVKLFIPSGTRVSIKSKSATASSGILLITALR